MTNIPISQYMQDGANWQTQALLAFIRGNESDIFFNGGIDSDNRKNSIYVGRMENCREQGYVFTLEVEYKSLKHVWAYEHRNSDELCLKFFDGEFINTPTINDIPMKDKYDYDYCFKCGEIQEAFEQIKNTFIQVIKDYKLENEE